MGKKILAILAFSCCFNVTIFSDEQIIQCLNMMQSSKVDECLNNMRKLAENIKNNNVRQCFLLEIEFLRKSIAKQAEDQKAMYETVDMFYENAGEMLADCSDTELKLKIDKSIERLLECFDQPAN